jgi:hypothetical protein
MKRVWFLELYNYVSRSRASSQCQLAIGHTRLTSHTCPSQAPYKCLSIYHCPSKSCCQMSEVLLYLSVSDSVSIICSFVALYHIADYVSFGSTLHFVRRIETIQPRGLFKMNELIRIAHCNRPEWQDCLPTLAIQGSCTQDYCRQGDRMATTIPTPAVSGDSLLVHACHLPLKAGRLGRIARRIALDTDDKRRMLASTMPSSPRPPQTSQSPPTRPLPD